MPANTTTHDESSDGIPRWAATTSRASIVKLLPAKGVRLFCLTPRDRAPSGTDPDINGAQLPWRVPRDYKTGEFDQTIRDSYPHATHQGQQLRGQYFLHCSRKPLDLDAPSTSRRHLRPLTADSGRVEHGDPDGCPPRPGRSDIPLDRPGRWRSAGEDGGMSARRHLSDEPVNLDELTLYTPAEAADILKVKESWLRRKAGQRAIPCTFLGKHLRFSLRDLHNISKNGTQPVTNRKRAF